jgi:hypothetical protein
MQNLKVINMKNAFKIGLLCLLAATTIVACDPHHSTPNSGQANQDSPKVKVDTTLKASIDTTKKDTTKK